MCYATEKNYHVTISTIFNYAIAEKMNGRFAMLGLLGTTLLEVLNNGHPMLSVLGIR